MFKSSLIISCALLFIAFGDDASVHKECKDNDCSGTGNDATLHAIQIIDIALNGAINKIMDTDAETS